MNTSFYTGLLLKGTATTAAAWLLSALLSVAVGMFLGTISCKHLQYRYLQRFVRVYTFMAKGVPAYVQILIAYFVIPVALGFKISGFWAATFALSFCSSGYVTEIIRAGINNVAIGQWEAAFVLGYPLMSTLRLIIFPQVLKSALLPLIGELEQLLKSTSLLATIGVIELTRSGMNIISRELNPIPVYLIIAAIYLVFSAVLQGFAWYLEQRGARC